MSLRSQMSTIYDIRADAGIGPYDLIPGDVGTGPYTAGRQSRWPLQGWICHALLGQTEWFAHLLSYMSLRGTKCRGNLEGPNG